MNIKKITCLLMSTVFIVGTVSNTNNVRNVYAEESVESNLSDTEEVVIDSETVKEETIQEEVTEGEATEGETTQEEIQSEENLNNISKESEESTDINKEDSEKKADEIENIEEDSEIEEEEEVAQYGVSVDRKTGIDEQYDYTTSKTTDYDTVHVINYSNGDNEFVNEGSDINPNRKLIITLDADINFDISKDTARIEAYGENSDSVVNLDIYDLSYEEETKKLIVTIDSSQLKKLSLGKNTLVFAFKKVKSGTFMKGTYYSIKNYISYLDINILELNKEIMAEYEDGASENAPIDSNIFTVENGVITKLNCDDLDRSKLEFIKIPDSIDGITIIGIGDNVFNECIKLREVELPDTLKTIGNNSFNKCTSLESIKLPNSLEKIGNSAFYECSALKEIIIPEGITFIGDYTFAEDKSLEKVVLPSSLKAIGYRAFNDCISFTILDCPLSIKTIGKEAFKDSGLTSIFICYDCYDIDNSAFDNCKIDAITVKNGTESQKSYQHNKLLKSIKNIDVIQPGKGYEYYRRNEFGQYGLVRIDIPEGVSPIYGHNYSQSNYPCLELMVVPKSTCIYEPQYFSSRVHYYGGPNGAVNCKFTSVKIINQYNTIRDREELTQLINKHSEDTFTALVNDSEFSFENSNVWEATINKNVKYLPKNAFKNCKELTMISIPYDCEVDKTTFEGCYNLSTVEVSGTDNEEVKAKVKEKIENSILGIGEKAKIASYTDKASDEAILTDDIFEVKDGIITKLNITDEDKAQLKKINVPNYIDDKKIEGIGSDLFNGCSELTSVILPDTITSIGSGAFVGCSNLTEVNIPEKVTEIENAVFSGCTNLSKITLPSSITKIGSWAFLNCCKLEEINIPEKVTQIGDMSFINCWNLKNINLPDTITSIGASAFENCVSVNHIKIPYSCKDFDKSTFVNDNNITLIRVYGGSNIEQEYIKEKIKRSIKGQDIGDYIPEVKENIAFYTDKASEDKILDDSIFIVEDGVLTGLQISDSDKKELTSIKIPEYINGTKITGIGDSLFSGCVSLNKVEIPDSIEKIYNAAFMNCTSLETITIPESVKEIGEACFAGCNKLETINLPSTLNKLSSYIFNGCFNLKDINIPHTITEIGSLVFGNCWNLESINIPDGVTTMGDSVFYGCINFVEINCPDSITSMGKSVFSECKNLKTVKLPRNVTYISERMFENCSELETVQLPYMITGIGECAFYKCGKLQHMVMQK